MKKKINLQLMLIAIFAIVATLVMTSAAFYDLFSDQVLDDLKTYSSILQKDAMAEGVDSKLRITVIQKDGSVIFDNMADSGEMENHSQRPEIMEALEQGEGTDIRMSKTLDKNTFYYARVLENGNILRVSKEVQSIWSIFESSVPMILLIMVALVVSSFLMAHILTKRLITPVEQLAQNLDQAQEIDAYEELQPFIDMINRQHEDIVKGAQLRQEFTANVSHELKTPLTSISGYAELIETGMASPEDVQRFASGIHKNSQRLLTLINDIIRLSELDTPSRQEEMFEMINLYSVAQTCVDMLQFSAQKHKVTLRLEGDECYVLGNKQMLDELLYNLCDNAIRYNNENGRVTVQVYPENTKTVLVVQDTGIGIPKESQDRIFERFYRVDKSRSKSTGGTGLGLAIVKHIVARHNADIYLESEEKKGTKITVTFV